MNQKCQDGGTCGLGGTCDDCEEYQEYLALLEEGYRPCDAAVRSGWKGAEEV